MATQFQRYGIGIDMSMDSFESCIKGLRVDETEKILGTRKFPNTASGFASFCQWFEAKRKDKSIPCRLLLEVTGVYHENLLFYLHDLGYDISLELGKRTKRYFESKGFDSKNDKEDAKGLASMILERKLKVWQPLSEKLYDIRQILRYRKSLAENKVAYQNQLHAIRYAHRTSELVLRSITEKIQELKKQIRELEQQAKSILEQDEQLCKRAKTIVDSLPGIGWLTIMEVLAETDGFVMFNSTKQLTKYAGYDIIERQSGKRNGKTAISKNGNARLRSAMFMPAATHIRSCKESSLTQLYLRLLKRNGGIHKKALAAVQRKLLCLIFTLWKSGDQYDLEYHIKNLEQNKNDKLRTKNDSSDQKPELHEIAKEILVLP